MRRKQTCSARCFGPRKCKLYKGLVAMLAAVQSRVTALCSVLFFEMSFAQVNQRISEALDDMGLSSSVQRCQCTSIYDQSVFECFSKVPSQLPCLRLHNSAAVHSVSAAKN